MTPGEKALQEAARLETARIYSALCREAAKNESPSVPNSSENPASVTHIHSRRKSGAA